MLLISELLKHIQEKNIDNTYRFSSEGNRIRFSQENQKPVVVWNVNEHCNMTCPHCYASAKIKKKEVQEISTKEAEKILAELKNYDVKILIFSGGEPLLRKDLFHLLEKANTLGFYCHLSTNGVLISEKVAQTLKDLNIRYVGISVDGLPDFNDSYRGLPKAFQKAFLAFEYLKKYNIKTGLRMTISKKNKDQLLPLLNYALRYNIDRFYISHLLYSGRGKEVLKDDLEPHESKSIMWKVFEIAEEWIHKNYSIDIVSGGNDVDGALLYLYIKEKYGENQANKIKAILEKRRGNTAGEKIINIDHLGNVHPDQFWRSYTAGNLLNTPLETILADELFQKLKIREQYLYECKDCEFLMMCRGSHRERALSVYNDLWARDPACYLYDDIKLKNKNYINELRGLI